MRIEAQITCVPTAIACAWTMGQRGHQVRIAIQKISENVDHAQAEMLVDDLWTPLTTGWDHRGLIVHEYGQHFPGEAYRYLTLMEFIQEQAQFAGQ